MTAAALAQDGLAPSFPRHQLLWPQVQAQLPPGELAHDRWHILRVYGWAMRLAGEAAADADLCGAAALVHDLVAVPKDHPDRALGGERSALAAGAVLEAAGYLESERSQVIAAVATSSWSRGLAPTSPIGVVLQDADRLDALGAVGLMRLVACAQWMSRPGRLSAFCHPQDALAMSGRGLDERSYAVDHCFAKLLKLPAGMHLPTARREAAEREAFLRQFLHQLQAEIDSQRAADAAIDRMAR